MTETRDMGAKCIKMQGLIDTIPFYMLLDPKTEKLDRYLGKTC